MPITIPPILYALQPSREFPSIEGAITPELSERLGRHLTKNGFRRECTEPDNWNAAIRAEAVIFKHLRDGVVLLGPTGRGKTALAQGITRDRCFVRTIKFGELDNIAPARFDNDSDAICYWVLDDVGAEPPIKDYGNTIDYFPRFVLAWDRLSPAEKRINKLIITTNLAPAGFAQRYGDRILSRLQSLDWIILSGCDKRYVR